MSQKTTTFSTRVSQQTLLEWKAATDNFNAWVVASLKAQFDLDQAEARDAAYVRQERIEQLESIAPGLQRAVTVGDRKPFTPDFK